MSSVLITGANRGIGLGLVREFLKNNQLKHLIATCRDPNQAEQLTKLRDSRLSVVTMEVSCDKSIEEACNQIDKIVGPSGLNVLINNAGILLSYSTDQKPDRAIVSKQLEVNATSPVIVTQYFLPLLKKAAKTAEGSKIIHVSSDLGSIGGGLASVGSSPKGFLAYRMSKSAVNSMTKCMAVDLSGDGIIVGAFHPGWVQTDMGGNEAPTTIEESASALVKSFNELNKQQTGGYFDRYGKVIPY